MDIGDLNDPNWVPPTVTPSDIIDVDRMSAEALADTRSTFAREKEAYLRQKAEKEAILEAEKAAAYEESYKGFPKITGTDVKK